MQFYIPVMILSGYRIFFFHLSSQVNTHTDRQDLLRQDFTYGTCVVIRRFKDFVWLSQRLAEEFPGIVMPALPVKMVVGKFDQTFVEVRKSRGNTSPRALPRSDSGGS